MLESILSAFDPVLRIRKDKEGGFNRKAFEHRRAEINRNIKEGKFVGQDITEEDAEEDKLEENEQKARWRIVAPGSANTLRFADLDV